MVALAALSDLSDYGLTPGGDEDVLTRELDAASEAIRDAAGSYITEQTSTVRLWAQESGSQWLNLPGCPVSAVSLVEHEGNTVTGYSLVRDQLWREVPWRSRFHIAPQAYDVTYTVGYATVPEDIVRLTCSLVAASALKRRDTTDADGLAVRDPAIASTSYQVDDASESVSYQQGAGLSEQLSVFDLPDRTRRMLAARFSCLP